MAPPQKKVATKSNKQQEQAYTTVPWLDLYRNIVNKLGYQCQSHLLKSSRKVFVIDDCNPTLFACQTISKQTKKTKKGEESGWLLKICKKNQISIHDKYQLWYPDWMIFRKKIHANRVFKELEKEMNEC
jgi:hypothetical protein